MPLVIVNSEQDLWQPRVHTGTQQASHKTYAISSLCVPLFTCDSVCKKTLFFPLHLDCFLGKIRVSVPGAEAPVLRIQPMQSI